MASTVCGATVSEEGSDFSQSSWQTESSAAGQNRRHFPVIINHSSPKSIRKVLAANTVPKSAQENGGGPNPQMNCFCCIIEAVESRRLRNCLYATAFVPASLLFLLFVLVWLSELGLI
ncbi:hypothetical protein niasHT_009337 [Heterodera trifolii]|uniref:Uncharacterized protein n=1 Tax=Heterodera trifolii TaxID=157864 RepID=A0ABD2LZ48_9BILA